MPSTAQRWEGKIKDPSATWEEISPVITRTSGVVVSPENSAGEGSEYRERFLNGANIYPRVLTTVEVAEAPALGVGIGRRAVRSSKGIYGNEPWKSMPDLEGVIEAQFVHPLLLGETIMPFWQREPAEAVLPLRSGGMMTDEQIGDHDGLRRWWTEARRLWAENQQTELTLDENVDHYSKLTQQFPLAPIRVVYGASGMHVTACRVTSSEAIVEHQLNWAAARTMDEALYLCTVLNSVAVTKAVEPFMVSGKGGGRHISSHLWKIPIPIFDSSDELHANLAKLGRDAEDFVAGLEVPAMKAHGSMRARIRKAFAANVLGRSIESAVTELLDRS